MRFFQIWFKVWILCLKTKHKIQYCFKYLVKICVNILFKDFEFSI